MKALQELDPKRFDSPTILKKLATSSRRLAELKGLAASMPNQGILINTLGLQEAKDSSEIENIVTVAKMAVYETRENYKKSCSR